MERESGSGRSGLEAVYSISCSRMKLERRVLRLRSMKIPSLVHVFAEAMFTGSCSAADAVCGICLSA